MNTDFDTTTRSAENQNRNGKGQWGGIAALTMLATFAFLTLIACYAWYGTDFLQRRDDAVGETLMREGKRREASFEYALALDFYQRALKARFNGPEHRTFTMERTGILLWQAGQAEDAAAILSEALTRDHVTTAPYSTLFEVLLHLNRTEEAAQLLETWKAVADTETDRAEQCHGAARLAEAQQHTKDAIKGYEHCVAAYDCARSAGRLAELWAEQGNRNGAVTMFERYFLGGAPEEDNDAPLKHYAQLLESTAN